jgi:hypothetical protein
VQVPMGELVVKDGESSRDDAMRGDWSMKVRSNVSFI